MTSPDKFQNLPHFPMLDKITTIVSTLIQNNDRAWLRVSAAYYMSVVASTMRTIIKSNDRSDIPVNNYSIVLGPSGMGKGYNQFIWEEIFTKDFRNTFVNVTMPLTAEDNMYRIAALLVAKDPNLDLVETFDKLKVQYKRAGEFIFAFDKGSEPAIKQVREKLLLAGCGAINLQIDELGRNLSGSTEAFNVFLELYDQGLVKNKITKSSQDNLRFREIEGKTPANGMFFGAPSAVLDGGKIEEELYDLLDTGYARRCMFAFGSVIPASQTETAEELYNKLKTLKADPAIGQIANYFADLADPQYLNQAITVNDEVGILLMEYKIFCEQRAGLLSEYQERQRGEITHRYTKALKLAGAYAFMAKSPEITKELLLNAIALVEESGEAFGKILKREKPYMKLLKYICSSQEELTHSDLTEELPFYKSSGPSRKEMLEMAAAWGYKQHKVLKRRIIEGIEFFSGEQLQQTSMDKLFLSYSDDVAANYTAEYGAFNKLPKLFKMADMHWTNHSFSNGHRKEDNVIEGFNLVVVDVDGGFDIDLAKQALKEYSYIIYTTKRHTDDKHRFRLVMPLNYTLKLDKEDYTQFMKNFCEWLPFSVDTAANQRSRKWLTNPNAEIHINETDKMVEALNFMPRTTKNERYTQAVINMQDLSSLERWFAHQFQPGNRNHIMIKYAYTLMDAGYSYQDLEKKVLEFNRKIENPLDEAELFSTVLKSVATKIRSKQQ